MKMRLLTLLAALPFMLLGMTAGLQAQQQATGQAPRRVIIFVWDGLRADDLTAEIAPNYFALARSGVVFADHRAVYPTFTMMNSASIATGSYPGVHGFYGNVVYAPSAKGRNAKGAEIDFSSPAFIEDFGVVEAVRDSYQGRLTLVPTMLQAAQAKGLTTAAVGKFGAAFIQDYKRGGIILDEDAAMPLAFAKELQQAGYPLPRNSANAYETRALTLASDNGDPTASVPIQRLKDGQTGNPLDCSGALSRRGFTYLTDVFVNYILPNKKKTGPDDLLVEGARCHQSRVRTWNVQLNRRHQDERRDLGPGGRKTAPTRLGSVHEHHHHPRSQSQHGVGRHRLFSAPCDR
jgi:hypothetical protein